MAAVYPVSSFLQIHQTPKFRLGKRDKDLAGNEYVYAAGVASLTADEAVVFDEAFATTRLVQASLGNVAISKAAVNSTAQYGWFQIAGKAAVKVASAFADNSNIYATATPGTVDDSGAGGEEFVFGATGRSAIDGAGTGKAYVQLSYPYKGTATLD